MSITTRHIHEDDGRKQRVQRGLGSGVIVDRRGHILTNHDVVENADQIKVTLPDERVFTGKLVGAAPTTDLAVVKIDGTRLPVAVLGDSRRLRVGEAGRTRQSTRETRAAPWSTVPDTSSKISIIPRGVAALGYTQQRPTEDRYLMTRAELLDRLDVLLGGRVAEELIFGDVSTGAQDDLQRATDIARHMITSYGMSEALGLARFEPPRQGLFLQVPTGGPKEYSERTAEAIDGEIQKLLDAAHGRVRVTLAEKRAILEALAKRLIEKEVVDRETLMQLIAETREPAVPPAASSR